MKQGIRAGLWQLLAVCLFAATIHACTVNWDPLDPRICGGLGRSCCVEGGLACNPGLVCVTGNCTCPGTQSACGDQCVDLLASTANCGSCGHACATDETCYAGVCRASCATGRTLCANGCADLQTSQTNCGQCGVACTTGTCVNGICTVVCSTGLTVCGAACFNLQTDVTHCGTCAANCQATLVHAQSSCTAGTCTLGACDQGWGDCDQNPNNGCSDSLSQPTHCGTCDNVCAAPSHAIATCSAQGTCGFQCDTGFADCNAMASDGCEQGTSSDPSHCGSCTTVCPAVTNAMPACTNGTCGFTCNTGFADCNSTASDGCESDLSVDRLHCGDCSTRCNGARTCVNGTCQ